ncbi:MAG: winged helix-turn-helix transcriptional regulator [Candidatus Thorarchaeota archaeon]
MAEPMETCSVLRALKILGRKWIPWILCELMTSEELYFTDLLNRVINVTGTKISARVLSESLTILEQEEIVIRFVESENMPIRVKYLLTQKGRDLDVVLGILKGWGIKWGDVEQKKCKSFTCVHNGIPTLNVDKVRQLLEFGPMTEIPFRTDGDKQTS